MQSTIKNDLRFDENGVLQVVPMEYPDWYGIPNIGFIWINSWADPMLEYKGKQINSYYVEQSMWEQFREDFPNANEDEFKKYMLDNKDDVYEYLNTIVEVMENETA